MPALNRKATISRGYAVRRPREGDGVGDALRAAFDQQCGKLPADMQTMLQRLDGTRPQGLN